MASTKVSALTAVSGVIGTQEFPVNDSGTSKRSSVTQLQTFLNQSPNLVGTPTAPTAAINTNTTQLATCAFVQTGGPVKVLALASDQANAQTTMVRVSGMDVTVPSGTYIFEYYIRAQTSNTANSMKFAVNHTGTTTSFIYNLFFPSAGVIAATGAVDQESNPTTGSIWAVHATRVINTTLGPQTDIDTINADTLYKIEGFVIVTVSGTLQLFHGSETAGVTSTIKAGTALRLTKVG
jgi:hypothetical protein